MKMKIFVPIMILMAIFIASVGSSTAQEINPDQLQEFREQIMDREIHPADQDSSVILIHAIQAQKRGELPMQDQLLERVRRLLEESQRHEALR